MEAGAILAAKPGSLMVLNGNAVRKFAHRMQKSAGGDDPPPGFQPANPRAPA